MILDPPLPGKEFFLRKLIAMASFLETEAPLRTAVTTAALRRATQRFVSVGGRSTVAPLERIKISPSVNPSMFSNRGFSEDLGKDRDTSDSNEDFYRSRPGNSIAGLC